MSGHSKWAQIKHKKGAVDQKRGALFSKLLKAVRAAALGEPNPDFNPRLRTAIETAKGANVPTENIRRAIEGIEEKNLEDITVEAYGPGGVAMIILAATDNKNRTIAELRKTLSQNEGKIAEPGSTLWAFERTAEGGWAPRFQTEIDNGARAKLATLRKALGENEDVLTVTWNAA
jgi:YebC/PmpR family DNA-binding regulatory protein